MDIEKRTYNSNTGNKHARTRCWARKTMTLYYCCIYTKSSDCKILQRVKITAIYHCQTRAVLYTHLHTHVLIFFAFIKFHDWFYKDHQYWFKGVFHDQFLSSFLPPSSSSSFLKQYPHGIAFEYTPQIATSAWWKSAIKLRYLSHSEKCTAIYLF